MKHFNELGLSKQALDAVARMGYREPTPVQEQAIPLVLAGRDIIAAAKTGTGKTGAFSLPALDALGHAKGGAGPLMLVVTPTRELAQQIGEGCGSIALSTHHRIVTVVGGLSYQPQIKHLKRGCDVLIATPGRLIDLMDQKAVRLGDVSLLVLDEADRMLDMGFLPSMKKIVAATPATRQTLLFSATIDRGIKSNMSSLLHDPAIVEIAHKGDVADTIDQFIIRTPQTVKPALLKALLEEKGAERVIVFARTRSRADSTCRRLKRAGYAAEAIHSDRSQNQRRRALDKFASGEVNILTATDVLARGIDVEEVDYVVNYDLPLAPEDYVHRIGRTGRAGAAGFSVSFVTPETESALKDIQELTKQTIPELVLESFDFAQAEVEAARKNIQQQARLDPEIAQAKRELMRKEHKRAAAQEQARATEKGDAGAKGGAHRKKRGQKASGESPLRRHADQSKQRRPNQQKARNGSIGPTGRTGAPNRSGSPATIRKQGGKQRPAPAPTASGRDFRPGRSQRAAVRSQRSGKRG